ncbi:MAG: winged helix-turn-helix domain-containing protein [Nocardioidaceae bacterium]
MGTPGPTPRVDDTAAKSFTLCISEDPVEQARVAVALGGTGVLIMVPDKRSALRVLLYREDGPAPEVDDEQTAFHELAFGDLVVDPQRAKVTWQGLAIELSQLEIRVLACLAGTPGVVWSYERLHVQAWGTRYLGDRDSLHSLVKRLRRKLMQAGAEIDVHAVRGVGFQILALPAALTTSL